MIASPKVLFLLSQQRGQRANFFSAIGRCDKKKEHSVCQKKNERFREKKRISPYMSAPLAISNDAEFALPERTNIAPPPTTAQFPAVAPYPRYAYNSPALFGRDQFSTRIRDIDSRERVRMAVQRERKRCLQRLRQGKRPSLLRKCIGFVSALLAVAIVSLFWASDIVPTVIKYIVSLLVTVFLFAALCFA